MIRRTDDFSGLSNQDLSKIASVVSKKESKKLFDVYDSEKKAVLASSELKINGYQVEVLKNGEKYDVYTIQPDTVTFDDAEKSGQFKKLAWGRYCFQRESKLGLFDYNFNDGSIWKLSTDAQGNKVLVKQVEEENPDETIRFADTEQKQQIDVDLTTTKVAANKRTRFDFVNPNSLDAVSKILYNAKLNAELRKDIIVSNSKNLLNSMNVKFNEMVDEKIEEMGLTGDKEEIKSLMLTALDEEITSRETLNSFLKKFKQDKLEKTGKQRRNFE
jgi:hypothetical protein